MRTGLAFGELRLGCINQARTYEFGDNFTWVKGRHSFKHGMDLKLIRAVDPLSFFGADNYGTFGFNGQFTNADFSDFLLGPSSAVGPG